MFRPVWILVASLTMATTTLGQSPTTVEATVNGQSITTADVDIAFGRTSVSKQPLDEAQRKMYRGHVLNVMIDNLLLKQFLNDEKVQADPKAVEAHIADFKASLAAKGTTMAAFLREAGASEERMRGEIADVHQWFAYVERQASEKNLRDYFQANRAAFDGSQVHAAHILVEFSPNATAEEKAAARQKLLQIQMQLSSGTDFADLAKKYSDCQSKAQGGDVGFFPRKGRMTESFAKAAFALGGGQVSDVVETEYGYHLIKLLDRRAGKEVPFETVAEDVESLYSGDLRAAIINAMRKQATIEINRPAAMTASDPATKTR